MIGMPSNNKDQSELAQMSGMGLEFAGSIIGMVFLGWLIDGWAETDRLWTITLGIMGIIGGGYNFFKKARLLTKRQNAKYRANHPSNPKKTDSDD